MNIGFSWRHMPRAQGVDNTKTLKRTSRKIGRFILPVAMVSVLANVLVLAQGAAEERLSGTVSFELEAERKLCSGCSSDEAENEIETQPIQIVFRPATRPDLRFAIELNHDVEYEGDLFGPGRTEVESDDSLALWVRKQLNDTMWARLQTEYMKSDKSFEFGGRLGFDMDLPNDRELSGYVNIDRRVPFGGGSTANSGTYVEMRAEHEWDWDEYGAWVEVGAERWFYDSSSVEDDMRVSISPGIWFELGDSPHEGLVWLETERRTRDGASDFERRTNLIGLGVDFDLGDGRELMTGVVFGRETETRAGRPRESKKVTGLVVEYQYRF